MNVRSKRGLLALLAWLGAVAVGGCEGVILEPPGAGAGDDRSPGPGASVPGAGHAGAADGVRRLTHAEYRYSVAALFGDDLAYRDSLAPDTHTEGYDRVTEGLTVSSAHIEGWSRTSASIADAALADGDALARHLDCDPAILPPRGAQRSLTQRGEDLVCSYLANCYRYEATGALSYPNYRNSGGSRAAPGRVYYEESVPSPGRYRITLDAHVSGSHPEPSVIRFVHGALGEVGRLEIDGDSFEPYSFVFEAEDAGVQPMTIEWAAPLIEPGRRVFIRTITLEGPLDEGAHLADERRACATTFAERLGELAFRRPLEPGERALLLEAMETTADFWNGLRAVIELLLQSPQFLYQIEIGSPVDGQPGWYALDDWELASRLSFMAWQAPPDAELREAARAGELTRPATLTAHAERLFADPRARQTVRRFYRQWLELEEVDLLTRPADRFPEFSPALREAMAGETERFLNDAIWESGLGIAEVLEARHGYVNAELAALYGLEAPTEEWSRVELPEERRGLLTQASLLAARSQTNQTSPVQRGIFVLERILCLHIPAPPDDLAIVPPSLEEEGAVAPPTTRDRWADHSSNPACAGCHTLIDPVGFAFEGFDPIGRHRTEEGGRPVDTRGGIPSHDIDDGSVSGAAELSETLASLPETADCLSRQWLRYGLGRLERGTDEATLDAMTAALEGDGIRAMLVALASTDAFRHRVVLSEVEHD